MDTPVTVPSGNMSGSYPMNPLGGCIDALLQTNVCLQLTGWEVTLWDPGTSHVEVTARVGDMRECKVGTVLQDTYEISALQEGVSATRLYPTQLALDAKYGDQNPKAVGHWSYDMSQAAQICWDVPPERLPAYIVSCCEPETVGVTHLRVGSLSVPGIQRTVGIDVSSSNYIIDPKRAL